VTLRSTGGNPALGAFDATDPASLTGAVALITGGASGLGLATGRALVDAGALVVLADLDVERGEAAAKDLGCAFQQCDVTKPENSVAAVEATLARHGRLDLAVLNAGIEGGGPIGDGFDLARYRAVMGVNTDGVAFGMSAALPALVASGGAAVATASLAGLTDTPLIAAFRDAFLERGFPLLEASDVAAAIISAALSRGTGECWVVQPGREPAPYGFRGVPGARMPDGQSASFF